MSARAFLILFGSVASAAAAAPTIDPQFGDHAVIQRGKPVLLSGTTAPRGVVMVTFADQTQAAKADAKGRWQAEFPARDAGKNLQLSVKASDGIATSTDLAFGDVWLCSGQSNMEYPLRRALNSDGEVATANDTDLRLMKVPQQTADDPQTQFAKRPQWQPTTPDAAKDFSAACYFMTRELRSAEHVPIGAIDDTWGATPVRQWMDEASVRAGGEGALADLVHLQHSNPSLALRKFESEWVKWWDSQTGTAPGQEPWRASDRLTWKPVPKVDYWDSWGPEWKSRVGAAWFRRRFDLTAAQAKKGATVSLGVFDDMDQTWVNGVPVGGTNDWALQRVYPVPTGVLRPGMNEIVIYVLNTYGPGGWAGPAEKVHLDTSGAPPLPLGDQWQYSPIDTRIANGPMPPWTGVASVSKIYNAMIAPLGPLGLKGVAWYQGEADVGVPGYDRRLAAWMADWRGQFRDPNLPFLIVGLAGWGKPVSKPVESGWAALINEQRLAVSRDPRTALASAIDLGVPTDIHPANKQEVGHRLAMAAKRIVYGDGSAPVGPMPVSAVRSGSGVVVTFNKPLQTLSGSSPIAFELCGTSCRYASAIVRGNAVELHGDGQPVDKVRYGWADYPVVNLYDLDQLPAPVFELAVQ